MEHQQKGIIVFLKVHSKKKLRLQVIGLPSQVLGQLLCVYIQGLGVDVGAEIELKDIGAESKVSIEDLCKKAVEINLREERLKHTDLTQVSTIITAHDAAWKKQDLAR